MKLSYRYNYSNFCFFVFCFLFQPDVTSPGTDIIAAYSEAISPIEQDSDKRRTPYITLSSTSMSRPHVAGLALLLKSLHPDWSPAAIKSAIITSGKVYALNFFLSVRTEL